MFVSNRPAGNSQLQSQLATLKDTKNKTRSNRRRLPLFVEFHLVNAIKNKCTSKTQTRHTGGALPGGQCPVTYIFRKHRRADVKL